MIALSIARIAETYQINGPNSEVRGEFTHQGFPHAPGTYPAMNEQHIGARTAHPVGKCVIAQSQTLRVDHAKWVYSPDNQRIAFQESPGARRSIHRATHRSLPRQVSHASSGRWPR